MNKGFFITLEGPDGCGKTTQSKRLVQYLKSQKRSVVHTREPGGTPFAEALRGLLLDPRHKVSPLAELMLFETIRAHHVEDLLVPSLKKGKVVVCDRFIDSTVAYQGYGRGLDLKEVAELNRIATRRLRPDLTIVLDLAPELGLARIRHKKSGRSTDRMEREALAFHRKVRQGFHKIARQEPNRVKVVDASGSVEQVQEEIRRIVGQKLASKRTNS